MLSIIEILQTKQISDPHSLTKFKDGSDFLTNDYRAYSSINLKSTAKLSFGTIMKNKRSYSIHLCKHNNYCICRSDKVAGCHYCKMERTENTKEIVYGDKTYNNREQFKETNLERFGYESYNQVPARKLEIIEEQHKISKKSALPIIDYKGFRLKGKWRGTWSSDKVINRYSFICKTCNTIIRRGGSYLNDLNCPKCNPRQSSTFEKEVTAYIQSIYKGEIVVNKRFGFKSLEIDIYLPDLKIGIECNGMYWHSVVKKDSNYHINKTLSFRDKNIDIIHLWEVDWNNKKELWKSMLSNKLKCNKYFVYARKCIIKKVNSRDSKDFLDNNHLFGNRYAKINIGLYFNNELVSLISFSGHKDYEYELIRYCNLKNHTIVGGFSKLWQSFLKGYQPETVFSYNDIDISPNYENTVYYQNGFSFLGRTVPSYFYSDKEIKYHRLMFKKQNLPQGYNEKEYTESLGLYKCYTAGNNKFLFNN